MSKQIVSGKVAKIFDKQLDTPDQYGNQYVVNVQLEDGNWYGFGKKKKPEINVKDGRGWHTLAEGDTVEFVTESREVGDRVFWNVRSSDVEVKEKNGNGGRVAGSRVPSGSSSGGSSVGSGLDYRQDSIMRQSAMGYAASVVAATLTSKSNLDEAAQKVVEIADEYFLPYAKYGYTTKQAKEQENDNVQQSQDVEGEDFNDDIPF